MTDTYTPHYNLVQPTVGGDPDTWGTLLNGNFSAIDTAIWNAANLTGQGQCHLAASGSNLLLSPANGNLLTIAGVNQVVPSAGVTLAPTGLAANTGYFVYAYMVGTTMTLEASTTAPTVDTVTGMSCMGGNNAYSLVGAVYCFTAGSFAVPSGTVAINVLSFFQRIALRAYTQQINGVAESPTPWTGVSLISWAGEEVLVSANGFGSTPLAGNTSSFYIALGGTQQGIGIEYSANTAAYNFPIALHYEFTGGGATNLQVYAIYGKNDGQNVTASIGQTVLTRG